ncbi:hypothetical protein BJ980_001836 [Nocardioides daedukensis]|uniref:DUF4232 domain-containing protein n=1 Tax=Nocardioides daedukensis TaxID=634462 RepID=A0A7Y9S2D8_9ACTN|nr:hypothetical protein [Nocardioides daedukensis]NYG58913.1 hypothetical protein [Nocardioides daedukensis]
MAPTTRPQRRLPARVYWVRRVVVFGTAFLLVFGLARLLSGGSDAQETGTDGTASIVSGAQSGAAKPSASASAKPSPTAKATRKPAKKKTKQPLAQPSGPCNPADIVVAPTVKRQAADGRIEIPFELRTKVAACSWTVSDKSLVIRISSGKDQIWSSQECAKIPSKDVVIRAAKPAEIVFVWNGRRSGEDCTRTAKWALPGFYHVTAAAFGGEPEDKQFELTAPSPKKIYKTEKPKPSKKKSKATTKPSASHSPSGAVEPND